MEDANSVNELAAKELRIPPEGRYRCTHRGNKEECRYEDRGGIHKQKFYNLTPGQLCPECLDDSLELAE